MDKRCSLSVWHVALERRSQFMIKLSVFKKKMFILWCRYQFCVSLRAVNTVYKHKWGYKLQNFLVAVLPSPRSISYLQYETNHTCQQPRPCCSWILSICNIIFPIILINADRYFLTLWYVMSWSSDVIWFWASQRPKFDPKKSVGPYVAKMFSLQSQADEGFCLY